MSTQQGLWPAPPKHRPLKPGEQIEKGATVYAGDTGTPYRFDGWMWCGRTRYALLGYKDERCCFVALDERLRLPA